MAPNTGSSAQSVLEAPPPRFAPDQVSAIASELFGVTGRAINLGSERDQTFLIDDGGPGAVLKISNSGEDPAALDFELEAILHITRVDPELPVPRPCAVAVAVAVPGAAAAGAGAGAGAGPAGYRATVEGPGGTHFVRLFERLGGHTAAAPDLDAGALRDYGATHARVNLALRSFFHPAAGRELLWDLKHAARLRTLLRFIRDSNQRALVEGVLDRYDAHVAPAWGQLRAQVVHGDLTLDNVLVDDGGRIAGIVDFGDAAHTAQVADLAVGLTSLLRGRTGDDVFCSARLAIDGYASGIPLEPGELAILGDLVAARLAALVTISAWRVELYPENAEYIQAWDLDSWALLELFAGAGADAVAREFGARRPLAPTDTLADRRRRILGSALADLTYRRPVHVVRGEGVWLFDADGSRLLDAYNNVPVVGHCHPRVTEAVVRQTRALNTHARYLYEPLVALAERLVASMPGDAGLDTVALVNSGTEANDLAWRIAVASTGQTGGIVTSYAYHGVSSAIADLSPEEWPERFRPSHVETIAAPGLGPEVGPEMSAATGRLAERGVGLAAVYIDGGFTSDGILTPPPADVSEIARQTREAGGLFVADEVQAGHGRTGAHLWSFVRYGIAPDIVTLGKPMGNGYPVAAVITRKELMDRFAATTDFFSTFGGNPVAAQAALAVLDVIEDERIVERAAAVGAGLISALQDLRVRHPAVVDIRGQGLLVGVELAMTTGRQEPDAGLAERVVNGLRDRGILIGSTGANRNVLKIRPPLVFAEEHAEILVDGLAAVLDEQVP
ncbi:MAG: aminotransferase class III-fold pyridoxal phosphate-dependent enzyme [Solirubrobacteraceae bacterium]